MIFHGERQLGDLLADGKITDRDAEAMRMFSEFLAIVGPADTAGQRGNARQRLIDAGREDLLDWALGQDRHETKETT